MKHELVDSLNCTSGKLYVDGTLGGGGHSELILQKIQPDGVLYSFDIDKDAIEASSERLSGYKNLKIINDSYCNIKQVLLNDNINGISGGVILDVGASYHQLTSDKRGFSFLKDSPLDMRFNQDADFSAYDIINDYSEKDLVYIFQNYGEETFSKRIAKAIVEKRKITPIKTTFELCEIIKNSTPNVKTKIHPATRVFQAIRIEVNEELKNLQKTLEEVIPFLEIGAIISILSFHSLEDRIVKQVFKKFASKCLCAPEQMICNCPKPILELVNKKPIMATEEELKINPPSRSAKLRIARRI